MEIVVVLMGIGLFIMLIGILGHGRRGQTSGHGKSAANDSGITYPSGSSDDFLQQNMLLGSTFLSSTDGTPLLDQQHDSHHHGHSSHHDAGHSFHSDSSSSHHSSDFGGSSFDSHSHGSSFDSGGSSFDSGSHGHH